MKRSLFAFAAAAVLAATISTSAQAADIRVRIGDGDNSLVFRSEPRVVAVPNTRVYYVQNHDYDLYRYGNYWYYVDDGYWYRASSWRGPFVQVRVSSVPRSVYSVPVRYRRHWRDVSYRSSGYYRSRDRDYRDYGGDWRTGSYVRVRIGDNASLTFRSEPRLMMVPNSQVYYVSNQDYDLYRYGGYWYYVDDGYWYRSSSWRGPFVQVRVSSVPRPVYMVPMRYRRHWRGSDFDNTNYYRSRDRDYRGYRRDRDYDRDRIYQDDNRDYDRDRNYQDDDQNYRDRDDRY